MNYREHGENDERPEGDRILILDDADGDGVADQARVYYQGRDIDAALGIAVLGNQVIVTAAPEVIVFTDEDGDDLPDSKESLFTRTGLAQNDHSTHSFVFGPDGKYYWNMGNAGMYVHDARGRLVYDRFGLPVAQRRVTRFRPGEFDDIEPHYLGGMVFRCNPDGSDFEVLGHNFRNNYEVAVDSFGNLWQSDNDDDGYRGVRINYVMEYGNYGYRDEMTAAAWAQPRTGQSEVVWERHWHQNDPGVVPNSVYLGAGSPTGITVYEGRLLPEVYWDRPLHADAGPGVVRGVATEKTGAGWSGEMVPLLGGEDRWARPVDVAVAPDGAVFVSDWYDPVVSWNRQADLDRGRVFRLATPGHRSQRSEVDLSTAAGAVTALKSPNTDARFGAWQALACHGQRCGGSARRTLRVGPGGLQGPRPLAAQQNRGSRPGPGSSVRWPMTTRTSASWPCERCARWRRDSNECWSRPRPTPRRRCAVRSPSRCGAAKSRRRPICGRALPSATTAKTGGISRRSASRPRIAGMSCWPPGSRRRATSGTPPPAAI